MNKKVLDIKQLKVIFETGSAYIKAVEGIDLVIHEGETVAIVGESGCGKSVTSLATMKLLTTPPAHVAAEKMEYCDVDGNVHDLLGATEDDMLKLREEQMAMVFQDPSSSLNPVMTIGEQIDEVFMYHRGMNRREARAASIEMLKKVGIPDPEMRYGQYPHELSGGLKQRILIAIATACKPRLLIADEPTTALDVTIQAQILKLMKDLCKSEGMALLFITHDLGVVRKMADRVYIMYCGKIVEEGNIDAILSDPQHPYTKALIETVPALDDDTDRFLQIPYNVPSPMHKPSGCYFSNRCAYCHDICRDKMPPLFDYEDGDGENRRSRCWYRPEELWKK